MLTKNIIGRFGAVARLAGPAQNTFFTYTNELSHPIPDRCPQIVKVEEAVSVIKSCKLSIALCSHFTNQNPGQVR